jgi:hypothetical protein
MSDRWLGRPPVRPSPGDMGYQSRLRAATTLRRRARRPTWRTTLPNPPSLGDAYCSGSHRLGSMAAKVTHKRAPRAPGQSPLF